VRLAAPQSQAHTGYRRHALRIPKALVAAYESGKEDPSPEYILRLARLQPLH
jgi:hypothetical protein